MINLDSWVTVAPDSLTAGVAGEAVILGLDRGMYYGLDAVGTRVWAMMEKGCRVDTIRDAMLAVYDVTPERCEADLLALLDELAANGLITVAASPP